MYILKRYLFFIIFVLISFKLSAQDADLCPVSNFSVFGGDAQNIISWSEPVGNPVCGDFDITELPFTASGTNSGAEDNWAVSGGATQGADVAYSIVLTEPTTLVVTLCSENTDYDTKLEIFTADSYCEETTTDYYNDDDATCTFSSLQSSLNQDISLPEGQYYIVVDGYNGAVGNYTINVFESLVATTGLVAQSQNSIRNQWPQEQEKMLDNGFNQDEINELTSIALDPDRFKSVENLNREVPEECGTFLTYTVYNGSDNSLLGETTSLQYTHSGLQNGTEYNYYVNTVYSEGTSESSETLSATPAEWQALPPTNLSADIWDEEVTLYWTSPDVDQLGLPYNENFDEGGLSDLWLVDGDNWLYGLDDGNPAPAMFFNWTPQVTDYEQSAFSPSFSLSGISNITVSYDLWGRFFNQESVESMSIEYNNGGADWTELATYDNMGEDIVWETFSHEISDITGSFQVRFRAHGETTFALWEWQFDNFSIVSSTQQARATYDFLGYNVYNGSDLVNSDIITDEEYTVTGLSNEETYTFGVTSVYEGPTGGDNFISDMITIDTAPTYVFGDITGIIYDPNNDPLDSVVVSCEGESFLTGEDGVYTLSNIGVGTQVVTASKINFYTNAVNAQVLAQAEPAVLNIIMSPDMPKPRQLEATPYDSQVNLTWRTPGSGNLSLYELGYDDGAYESFIGGGSIDLELAVLFTPGVPGELMQGRFIFGDAGYGDLPVEVRVYSVEDNGSFSEFYVGEDLLQVSQYESWIDYDFSSPLPFNENGFLMGFRFTSVDGPLMALDDDGYIVDHNYVNLGAGYDWAETGSLNVPANYMIHAVAALSGEPMSVSETQLTILTGGINSDSYIDIDELASFTFSEQTVQVTPDQLFNNTSREDEITGYEIFNISDNDDGGISETLVGTTVDTFTVISVENNYVEYCYDVRAVWNTDNYGSITSNSSNLVCAVPFTFADADFDSDVDIQDVISLVDFILEQNVPTDNQFRNLDVNEDGELNVADVVMAVDIIYAPSLARTSVEESSLAYLDAESDLINSKLNINLDGYSSVRGVQFELSFNPQLVQIDFAQLSIIQDNVLLNYNNDNPGEFKVLVANLNGGTIELNNNQLITIPFTFLGEQLDSSPIEIYNIKIAGKNGDLVSTISNSSSLLDIRMIPNQFVIHQNYPNPFNPTTDIRFDLSYDSNVSIDIYNIMGQNVRSLVSKEITAGFHSVKWDGMNDQGSKLSSGMYIYTVKAGKNYGVKKMLFMK